MIKGVEGYWGVTGIVEEIVPNDIDDFTHYIRFNTPLHTLKGEYFAPDELEILSDGYNVSDCPGS